MFWHDTAVILTIRYAVGMPTMVWFDSLGRRSSAGMHSPGPY